MAANDAHRPILDNFPIGFGLDRDSDIQTLQWYLRRLARPDLLACLIPRMTDTEREQMGETIAVLLRKYLSEEEYHRMIVDLPEEPRC